MAAIALERDGTWHAGGRRVPHHVRPVFKWMRGQMRQRVAGATGRSRTWLNVRPMLRSSDVCNWSCTARGEVCERMHMTPGKAWLHVRIPAERVLLSDYELWAAYVIRCRYLLSGPDDARHWDRVVRELTGASRDGPTPSLDSSWPQTLIDDLLRSWDRIFDVQPR